MHKGLYHDESRKEEFRDYGLKNNPSLDSREILDDSQIGKEMSAKELEDSFQQGIDILARLLKLNGHIDDNKNNKDT